VRIGGSKKREISQGGGGGGGIFFSFERIKTLYDGIMIDLLRDRTGVEDLKNHLTGDSLGTLKERVRTGVEDLKNHLGETDRRCLGPLKE